MNGLFPFTRPHICSQDAVEKAEGLPARPL